MQTYTWGVTVADVLNVTGQTVTTANVTMADSMITVYANRTAQASGGMSARDIYAIQTAICWQAAWLPGQPALSQRQQFDTMTQDGLSVSSRAEWAKLLAPMAARSLKNLSWKGTKTARALPVEIPRGDLGLGGAFLLDEGDWYTDFSPLEV